MPEENMPEAAHNPYLAARKEWDERYGDLLTRARNWRFIAVMLVAVALVQGGELDAQRLCCAVLSDMRDTAAAQ